jgi:hypothetical protein
MAVMTKTNDLSNQAIFRKLLPAINRVSFPEAWLWDRSRMKIWRKLFQASHSSPATPSLTPVLPTVTIRHPPRRQERSLEERYPCP